MKKNLLVITFLIILLGSASGNAHAAIPAAERQALIALYNSTNGDDWTNNSGWKSEPLNADGFAELGSEGLWFGITLNSSGTNITGIIYNFNRLSGSIPAEIGNLTSLQDLRLYSNKLSGNIPAEVGNLTDLQDLQLHNNQLSGNIPATIGNLTKLQTLFLGSNQLSGSIPVEIGSLTHLQDLRLYSNELSGSIPSEIGSLPNLQNLFLHNNRFSGSIPVEAGNLTALQNLLLNDNELSGSIPAELGNLINLNVLSLHYNQLAGLIPVDIMTLTNLEADNSDFRWNHLYTDNDPFRDFLNTIQTGGDWESSQVFLVPVTVGMPQASAESAITAAVLDVGHVTMACDDTISTGIVISSNPTAGAALSPAASVSLVVSTGPDLCPDNANVPNIVGMTSDDATFALTAAVLEVGDIILACDGTIPEGTVISSFPAAGAPVTISSLVDLIVSDGSCPESVTVPKVEGMPQASAESVIAAAGLSVGDITTAYDDTISAGNVINSNIAAGTSIAYGSPVNLVVSSGPSLMGLGIKTPTSATDNGSGCFIESLTLQQISHEK